MHALSAGVEMFTEKFDESIKDNCNNMRYVWVMVIS